MDSAAGIQKLGFRRWYERELIKCHGSLVTCFLCGLTVAALIEQMHFTEPLSSLVWFLVAEGATYVGWMSWRSYITRLRRAENYGQRSSCPACGAYGRFRVLATGGRLPSAEEVDPWLRVECRRCAVQWRMPE